MSDCVVTLICEHTCDIKKSDSNNHNYKKKVIKYSQSYFSYLSISLIDGWLSFKIGLKKKKSVLINTGSDFWIQQVYEQESILSWSASLQNQVHVSNLG